jgi:non-ribosomal peptide synthetase component F
MLEFPESQQAVKDKCIHPTGIFFEFKKEEIEQSIPERFEQQVCNHPDRLAIETESQQLSYTALNEAANRVAWGIITALKGRESRLRYCLSRGLSSLRRCWGC